MGRVSDEVAKLSNKVVALERNVQGGSRAEDKEFVVLIEFLMVLKLDEIEADGELKVQRKREVCRVQSFVESELCEVVGRTVGEKPLYEPRCILAGYAVAKVRKSVLFFSSLGFNNHNT